MLQQAQNLRDVQLSQMEYDEAVACFDKTLPIVGQARVWNNQIEESGPAQFILPVRDPRLDAQVSIDGGAGDDAPER